MRSTTLTRTRSGAAGAAEGFLSANFRFSESTIEDDALRQLERSQETLLLLGNSAGAAPATLPSQIVQKCPQRNCSKRQKDLC
jgi:hypothetical protein